MIIDTSNNKLNTRRINSKGYNMVCKLLSNVTFINVYKGKLNFFYFVPDDFYAHESLNGYRYTGELNKIIISMNSLIKQS